VTREGVPQVVEAKRRPAIVIQPGELGGAPERAAADVAVAVGGAAARREHPVVATCEGALVPVCAEQARELRDERDVADRRGCLRRDAPRWCAAMGAGELRTHVDYAGGEVDVVPDEAEQLRDAQAGVEHGGDHQPVARRAGREQALDLRAAEHALAAPLRPRALVVLEQLNGVGDDPTAAAREAHDALERRERARSGLRRPAGAPQLVQQLGDVIDSERRDRPLPQGR
jgi:hypothetical protein